jgi:Predicted integral membrane protein
MTLVFLIEYLHVLGAIVILGTGTGIAFFMLMAHRSGNAEFIARTAATVVIADMLFTLTAVLLQPVTGGLLMMLSSTSLSERWLLASLALYAIAGLFWVPVIFMQIEMRDLARLAAEKDQPLPPRYFALFRRWFLFGIPGFGSVMIILWLMIAKPG